MAEYDAIIVFLVATLFVGVYIFNEARPKGSNLISKILVLFQDCLNSLKGIIKSPLFLPLATLITFFIGSLANVYINQDDWYRSLNKSTLNPPGYVFGIVWPVLYVLMGLVSYFNFKQISKLFLIQLVLNAIWSWIFFYFQMPIIALSIFFY